MSGKFPIHPVRGFTLIELLIAMTIGLMVLGAAYRGFIGQRRILSAQAQATEMLQNARAAVDFMARELRMATDINPRPPLPRSNPLNCDSNFNSSVTYISAVDRDTTQKRELYWSNSDTQHPTLNYREGDSRQPLAENVSCLNIALSGNLFTVTLTARTDAKDPIRRDYRSVTISAQVRARCLQASPGTTCS